MEFSIIDSLILIILLLLTLKYYITSKYFSETKLPIKFTFSRIEYMKRTTENYTREIVEAVKRPELYQSLNIISLIMSILSTIIFILPYLGNYKSNLKINLDVLDLFGLYILSFGV